MISISVNGRLTADPIQRTTAAGVNFATFTIATTISRAADGKSITAFPSISAFGKIGEALLKYMRKGSAVVVCGRVSELTAWRGRDEVSRPTLKIIADHVEFIGSKNQDSTAAAKLTEEREAPRGAEIEEWSDW